MWLLQNCFISSAWRLENWCSLSQWSVITENSSIYKFPKEVYVAGSNRTILLQFCTSSSIAGMHFFLNSAFRVHIISRQMKYVKHMEFSNVFLIQESFTVYTPNLFCPFDHLPNTVATQITYLICLYSLTLNLTWWGCAMCRQQWRIYIFQRRSLLVSNQIF